MSTRKDFARLLKKTTAGSHDAPWWVRLLLNAFVSLLVLGLGAVAYDGLIAPRLAREPIAVCTLLGLFPFDLFQALGLLSVTIGIMALALGIKEAALRWLVIGFTCMILPELYVTFGPVRACTS